MIQFVPRSKHIPPPLQEPNGQCRAERQSRFGVAAVWNTKDRSVRINATLKRVRVTVLAVLHILIVSVVLVVQHGKRMRPILSSVF